MPFNEWANPIDRYIMTTQDSGSADTNPSPLTETANSDGAPSRELFGGAGFKPILIEDWDCLFGAVQDRIAKATASLHADSNRRESGEVDCSHVYATLLDCSADLTRLHAALRIQRLMRATV